MEEKKFIKYERDEVTGDDVFTAEFIRKIKVDIVERQDEMIRQAIHKIGGEEYEHITIDKNKILAMLEKTVKKKVVKYKVNLTHFDCPSCRALLISTTKSSGEKRSWYPNYCPHCGQALDWDLEVEDGQ